MSSKLILKFCGNLLGFRQLIKLPLKVFLEGDDHEASPWRKIVGADIRWDGFDRALICVFSVSEQRQRGLREECDS
ncbi:hypothetical protein Bpfe_010897 [Biomphalaria pfeifferi]|uniref:Uncharacterized protein n=1 Tax=Biomphalaria pfeifferi TaxID=112525 RepID=A0AAD8BRX8_BIOPF|nr:hypothetical protein Bpfe_010897 [Biomphalaria pfeifferi]